MINIQEKHFTKLPICAKMYYLQYYLVATVIHVQSVRSQIFVYIHIFFTI